MLMLFDDARLVGAFGCKHNPDACPGLDPAIIPAVHFQHPLA